MRMGVFAVMLCCAAAIANRAGATTLTFDDEPSLTDLATVSPYNGFNFTNFLTFAPPAGEGNYTNGVVSGPNLIFSGSGSTPVVGTISGVNPFTFNSAYMTYGWLPGLQVVIDGYNGGTLEDTETVTLTNAAATLFTFDWANLTSVTFASIENSGTSDPFSCGTSNCSQFTIDNLTVNNPVNTPVPEPASLAIFGAGLAALRVMRRKRKAS